MGNPFLHTCRAPTSPPDPFSPAPGRHTLGTYTRALWPRMFLGLLAAAGMRVVDIAIPQVLSFVVDDLLAQNTTEAMVWAGGTLVLGLGLTQVALMFARRMLLIDPTSGVEKKMRMNVVDKLLRQPLSFHDRWASGQLLQRTMGDLNTVRQWLGYGLIQLISVGVMMVVGVVLLARSNMLMAGVFALSLPLFIWVTYRFVVVFRGVTRTAQEQASDLATAVEESVRGIRVLKALGRGDYQLSRFTTGARELQATEVARGRYLGRLVMYHSVITGITTAAILALGLHFVAAGQLTVGELAAFCATIAIVSSQLQRSGGLMGMALSAKVSMDRHREIVELPDVEDIELIPTEGSQQNQPESTGRQGTDNQDAAALTLDGVTFGFGAAGSPVLNSLSLEMAPGEIVALVGATGSGKSALLQLIPSLYRADAGQVLIDGAPSSDSALGPWRSISSVAFEEPVLFSDTVANNVLLGLDAKNYSPEERERILTQALEVSASEFVYDLPEGTASLIGEEGMSLSGGQRQRLSLARAIAARPRILLLDDPLSALDVTTEKLVVQRLKETLTQTTVLLTAHRPSTVALADRVALLEDGAITAIGTVEQMNQHPGYRALMVADETQGWAK